MACLYLVSVELCKKIGLENFQNSLKVEIADSFYLVSVEKCEIFLFTGKSLSEALIFASTNPQYDYRLFIELQVQYMKIPSSNVGRTCCVKKLFLTFNNMFSPCSAKRRASDKDLPVQWMWYVTQLDFVMWILVEECATYSPCHPTLNFLQKTLLIELSMKN